MLHPKFDINALSSCIRTAVPMSDSNFLQKVVLDRNFFSPTHTKNFGMSWAKKIEI